MTEWKGVLTDGDIQELLETYGGFHDSCIASLNYRSGYTVNDDGSMNMAQPEDFELSVIFHSQWNPKFIELCFGGVRRMRLVGLQDNNTNEISEAFMGFYEGILPCKYKSTPVKSIVWADNADFDVNNIQDPLTEPSETYIIAATLKWRII